MCKIIKYYSFQTNVTNIVLDDSNRTQHTKYKTSKYITYVFYTDKS